MDDRAPPPTGGHRGQGWPQRQPGRGVRRLAGLPRGDRRSAPARPRLRGSPLGGRWPARLRRPPRRLGDARAATRRGHGPSGAALAALRLGRRQDECAHTLARATIRQRDGGARARAPRARRDLRRHCRQRCSSEPAATRSTRRNSCACSTSVPTAHRCRRRCRGSSRPVSTCSSATRRSCSRTQPCSAGCSGSGAWHASAMRRKPPSIDSSDASSCSVSDGAPSRARPSTRSGMLSFARSPTSRFHVRSGETSTAASPTGSRASGAPRTSRSCSRITTSLCSSIRNRMPSSPHGPPARSARRVIGHWRSTPIGLLRTSIAARSSSLLMRSEDNCSSAWAARSRR